MTTRNINLNGIKHLFIKYCKVNTRSDPDSHTTPTTPGQIKLAKIIIKDVKSLDIPISYNRQNGFVTVELLSNTSQPVFPIGFDAHLDTADFNADGIKPEVHPNYNGQRILLDRSKNIWLDPKEFPRLRDEKGHTLITTDGTTLLGADDKAGIVAAIEAVKYFVNHPSVKHGKVKFSFGPDEEIGRGAKKFDAKHFNTKFLYTLDNGFVGQIKNQTFNASQAEVTFKGTAVHPGGAYHSMVNALSLANQFINGLPKNEIPAKSRGLQGFFLVLHLTGSVEHAKLILIVRDFDVQKYHAKNELLRQITNQLNQRFSKPRVSIKITQQYRNFYQAVKQHPYILNLAKRAYREIGITPKITAFRGGTDGNFITPKGIPAPNLFNGGGNYHGKYEYDSLEDIRDAAQVIIQIIIDQVKYYRQYK